MKTGIALFLALILSTLHLRSQQISWDAVTNSPENYGTRYEDIFSISPDHIWALSLEGIVVMTRNGGQTWETVGTKPFFATRSIAFHDTLNGWIGTLIGKNPLIRTTDGGKSWQQAGTITGAGPKGVCGLSIVNRAVIYGAGKYDDSARVIRTNDSGKTWTSIDMKDYASTLVDCYFWSPDSGLVTGGVDGDRYTGNSVVLFTSDGGTSWKTVYRSPRKGEQGWKIFFRTKTEGYVAVQCSDSAKYYLKTTDGGQSWQDRMFTYAGIHTEQKGSAFPQGIAFTTEKHGWIGGWGPYQYRTGDGGETWTKVQLGENFNRFRKLSDTLTLAGASRIYSIKTKFTTPVEEAPGGEMQLSLYPNPAGRSLSVSSGEKFFSLSLIGSDGKLVREIPFPEGSREIAIDTDFLAQGSYFLQIDYRHKSILKGFSIVR